MGAYRFLEFGEAIEGRVASICLAQAGWSTTATRAMLLGGFCHEQPESALFLGRRCRQPDSSLPEVSPPLDDVGHQRVRALMIPSGHGAYGPGR
jgi:hypothetical protein